MRASTPTQRVATMFVGADAHIRPSAFGRFADGSMRASTPTAQKRGCLIKSQPLCKMHSSNSRAVHFAPPAGGLLNAQGAQGRPLHTSPAKFLCIFLSCCYFETTRFSHPNIPVDKYRSPRSGSSTTTVLPWNSGLLVSCTAAKSAAPPLGPVRIPSVLLKSLAMP